MVRNPEKRGPERSKEERLNILVMVSGVVKGESGMDHLYLHLAEKLRKQGHGVTFYVFEPPPGKVYEIFARAGASFQVRGLGRRAFARNTLQVVIDCLSLSLKSKPDLLVGHFSLCGNVVALVGRLLRIPCVKVCHSVSTHLLVGTTGSRVGLLHRLKQQLIGLCATRVVAVSDALAADLVDNLGLRPARVRVLKNGLDPSDYKPLKSRDAVRQALGIPPESCVLLTVAGFIPLKGHKVLLQATAKLPSKNVHLVLVGAGPLRKECEILAEELGIGRQAHFLGRRNDVPDLLAAADICVLPSLSEAFPFFLLESMSASLPVIASRVGGIPEIVSDGKTGLLVPTGDVSALAEAISSLLADPGRAEQMGRAGREKLMAEFSLDDRIDREIALYRGLVSGATLRHPL